MARRVHPIQCLMTCTQLYATLTPFILTTIMQHIWVWILGSLQNSSKDWMLHTSPHHCWLPSPANLSSTVSFNSFLQNIKSLSLLSRWLLSGGISKWSARTLGGKLQSVSPGLTYKGALNDKEAKLCRRQLSQRAIWGGRMELEGSLQTLLPSFSLTFYCCVHA